MSIKIFYNRTKGGARDDFRVTPVAVGSIADKPHQHAREQARRQRQLERRAAKLS